MLNGDIKDLEYKSQTPDVSTTSGGALAKTVPLPKNTNKAEDDIFRASLSKRES